MTLTSGTKLGPYEIVSVLGAGGMGEVYRARDIRLDRFVAIKVVSTHLSSTAELKQRFEREARAISALSHPNICHLYDVGSQDGTDYLVMEYLEGETLAQRLEKGSLPLDQVLKIGMEVADALDKAHRHGIIHRDLKPGNIMLTKSGAKLMDFGLAKSILESTSPLAAATGANTLTAMATGSKPLTQEGTIIGTFQYMAPEQLEGKEADARSDIFALGSVIYEMATGKPAFSGKTQASVIASILASEPPPINALAPMSPPALERLIRICLAKDPEDRWQTAHDIRLQLRAIADGATGSTLAIAAPRGKRERFAWALAIALPLLAIAVTLTYFALTKQPLRVVRSSISPPANLRFQFSGDAAGPMVISPDGTTLAFALADSSSNRTLWVRKLSALDARPISGTAGAFFPFWSADSRSLGFFADGKLKRVTLDGSAPLTLADAGDSRGGAWGSKGVIVFSSDIRTGLMQISASGGVPKPVTNLDESRHSSHRWPYFLPDGEHFLYLAVQHANPQGPQNELYIASISGGESKVIFPCTTNAVYSAGQLLFGRDGMLMRQPFNVRSGQLEGEPAPVAEHLHVEVGTWRAVFDASEQGPLAYQRGAAGAGGNLVQFDRTGKKIAVIGHDEPFFDVRVSPDGKRLAAAIGDPISNIWIFDLARKVRTKLTFEASSIDLRPIWSRDGAQIVFSRFNPELQLMRKSAVGTGQEEVLLKDAQNDTSTSTIRGHETAATDVSPDDGSALLNLGTIGDSRLMVLALKDGGKPYPLAQSRNGIDQFNGRFSPDGNWVIYTSRETGRQDVYVVPFDPRGGKWQISTNGGSSPQWSRDGTEVFYIGLDSALMRVPVHARGSLLEIGTPERLFQLVAYSYDVSPDGKTIFASVFGERDTEPITLVTNWTAEIKK